MSKHKKDNFESSIGRLREEKHEKSASSEGRREERRDERQERDGGSYGKSAGTQKSGGGGRSTEQCDEKSCGREIAKRDDCSKW